MNQVDIAKDRCTGKAHTAIPIQSNIAAILGRVSSDFSAVHIEDRTFIFNADTAAIGIRSDVTSITGNFTAIHIESTLAPYPNAASISKISSFIVVSGNFTAVHIKDRCA